MHKVLKANDVSIDEEFNDQTSKCKVFYMRDYIHGFCNMDTNYVGFEEFALATELTC